MASVLFTTVGQAVGGPLGAAVGAAVGGSIDAALFSRGGAARELQLLRSAYGEPLPRLFGATRTSGVLIWSQPMREGAGKGDGRRGHSTSFAIALSSGPIREVRRMWADGREFRNVAGDFESPTTMRVYGGGAVGPDPLIVAAEGLGGAPGYLGLSYVVFEELALAPFGNRIPNLSFEVVADDGQPATWLEQLLAGRGEVEPGPSPLGQGYVALAERTAEDVAFVGRAAGLAPCYPTGSLRLAAPGEAVLIPRAALGASAGEAGSARSARLGARPGSLGLGYLDPERDYQAGRQLVTRGRTGPELGRAAPLTATATAARLMAERWLKQEEAAVELLTIQLSWAWLHVSVGDVIAIEGRPETWRVVRRDVVGLMLRLTAALLPGVSAAVSSDGGRGLPAPVQPAPMTDLTLFETPVPLRGGGAGLWVAAGGGPGWRGAEIRLLAAGLETSLGRVVAALPWGILAEPLSEGPETIWDEAAEALLTVEARAPIFESRAVGEVLAGANLALVGEELIQFREAVLVEAGRVLLRGLLRGRFGTRASAHTAGSGLRLLREDMLPSLALTADSIGRSVDILGLGPGDPPGGTRASHVVTGSGLGPMGPVHVRAVRRADGAIESRWVARGREALDWGGTEPTLPGFVWRYKALGANTLSWAVVGTSFELGVAMQEAAWGGLLPEGEIQVLAAGNGPEAVRASRAVRVAPAS